MKESQHPMSRFTYGHFEQTDAALILRTAEGAALRVAAFGDGTAQIWFDPIGAFDKPASFAVENERPFGALACEETADALRATVGDLTIIVQKSPLTLCATQGDKTLFSLASSGIFVADDGRVSLNVALKKDEHIVGLGEDNDAYHGTLERRGTCRDMLTGQTIASGCVTADLPLTFYMSSEGYGLYVDNSHRARYDVGKTDPDVFNMDFEGGEMIFYIFAGPTFRTILTRYTNLTGKPSLPPLWTQGYIQSKCTYRTWDEIDDIMTTFREKDFPIDGYVIDADWPSQYVSFEFDDRWQGKSAEKIKEYSDKGYKLMLSTSGPMIKKDCKLYESAVEADIFVTDGKGNTVTCGWYGGELMDFSSPKMHDWIKPLLTNLLKMGVKAWWLDLIEPEGDPMQSVYQGGTRARIHNAFALLNTKLYYEITKEFDPSCRPFILGRTATAGIQKYGSSTWTGDVYCDWDTLRAHCPEALNTALSGIPNWTCDTGGFITESLNNALRLPSHYYQNDATRHAHLFVRWWQLSCFAPITRAHHVGPCEPFAHGARAEAICKRYIKLRYALLPYIYTYAHDAAVSGMGVMRALPYLYQNDPEAYRRGDEFLFGDSLLVAPVLEEYANAREVYFPGGTWYDFDERYRYDGNSVHTVYAPLDRIPLFVRAGAILPMIPDMLRSDEKAWDPIIVHIWPEGDTAFTAYLDDGETTAWQNGEYTLTTFACLERGNIITLSVKESNKRFTPTRYHFAVHMKRRPLNVEGCEHHERLREAETNGGWFFNPPDNVLHIFKGAPEGESMSFSITLDEFELYLAPAPCFEPSSDGLRVKQAPRAQVQLPFLLPPASLPGTIKLHNFDRGGEQVAYHMHTRGNAGGLLRDEDVNISLCGDEGGGYQLSDICGGEWLCYTVNVEQAGMYNLALRVASAEGEASFHVYFDGRDLTGKVAIPYTGGKSNWVTVSYDGIDLKQGEQVVKLLISEGPVQLSEMKLKRL